MVWEFPYLIPDLVAYTLVGERIQDVQVGGDVGASQLQLPHVIWIHPLEDSTTEGFREVAIGLPEMIENAAYEISFVVIGDRGVASHRVRGLEQNSRITQFLKCIALHLELLFGHSFEPLDGDLDGTALRALQPQGIQEGQRVRHVGVVIRPRIQPQRVGADVPTGFGGVIAQAVVVETGLAVVVLTRETKGTVHGLRRRCRRRHGHPPQRDATRPGDVAIRVDELRGRAYGVGDNRVEAGRISSRGECRAPPRAVGLGEWAVRVGRVVPGGDAAVRTDPFGNP